MGRVPFVPSAVLMAAVSAASEKPSRPGDPLRSATKAPGPSRPEPRNLVAFLQMNAEEKFDIEAINAIDPPALVGETHGDKRVVREVLRTAEALLPRVRAETEDPLLVSAILRAKTFDWYERSPSDPDWAGSMPLRWGGIFYESRVPGGRLSRKLSVRLTLLINQCVDAAGAVAFLRAGVAGIFRGSAMMAKMVQFTLGSKRPRFTQQVAQAYLDDLAATARRGDAFLPLERLSDLAQAGAGPMRGSRAAETAATESIPSSPWERTEMTRKDWLAVLKGLEKRKARLEAPPRDNPRDRESYLGLRELILTDASGRKAFMVVHWKGKPSGLTLLCQLLSDGTLVPEADTDGDYLEAELDHPDKGHADRRAKDGQWNIGHGWTVIRERADGGVRTYRAESKSVD